MASRVSTSELAEQLPDILARVYKDGERFVIERDGVELAVLQPSGPKPGPTLHELPAVLAGVPWPDSEFFDELEAIRAEMNVPVEPPEWPS